MLCLFLHHIRKVLLCRCVLCDQRWCLAVKLPKTFLLDTAAHSNTEAPLHRCPTLPSLPFLPHLTVTEIQRPPSSSPPSASTSSSPASSIHGLRDKAGCLLQRLARDIYGAFTPPPFHSETLTPPFTPPPSPKTISELDT